MPFGSHFKAINLCRYSVKSSNCNKGSVYQFPPESLIFNHYKIIPGPFSSPSKYTSDNSYTMPSARTDSIIVFLAADFRLSTSVNLSQVRTLSPVFWGFMSYRYVREADSVLLTSNNRTDNRRR